MGGRFLIWGLMMITSLSVFAQAQTSDSLILLTGQVVADTALHPIPYAHLSLVGAQTAATTDGDGNFRLRLPQSDTLKITAVGFVTQKMALNTLTEGYYIIQLDPDTLSLPTHNVIGYSKWHDFKNDFKKMNTDPTDSTDIVIPGARQYRGRRYTPPASLNNPVSLVYENFSPQAMRNKKMKRAREKLKEAAPNGYDLKNLPALEPGDTLTVDTLRLTQ